MSFFALVDVLLLNSMMSEAKALGISYGIYSSPSQWNPIMGGSSFAAGTALWVRMELVLTHRHGHFPIRPTPRPLSAPITRPNYL